MSATGRDRGQLVLLAAALVAVALVPMAFAYLQLGAHPDVAASTGEDHPDAAVRAVERAAANASAGVSGRYAWSERDDAVAAFDHVFGADVSRIERSHLRESVAVGVETNATAAAAWAASDCPAGSNRRFGPCVATDGLVVQERVDETVVVALAADVTVTAPRGTTSVTVVVTAPFA